MLSCKETSLLISQGLDSKLPLHKRIALRVHVLMCSACRTYRRQVTALHGLIARRFKKILFLEEPDRIRLPADARERIKTALRK